MTFKFVVLFVCIVVVVRASLLPIGMVKKIAQPSGTAEEEQNHNPNPPFQITYDVEEEVISGHSKRLVVARDDTISDVVQGDYLLNDANDDGARRTGELLAVNGDDGVGGPAANFTAEAHH